MDGYQVSNGAAAVVNGVTRVGHTAPFFGPAGVAGMAINNMTFTDQAYLLVESHVVAGTDNYYNLSWAELSALMMTGNFVNYLAPP